MLCNYMQNFLKCVETEKRQGKNGDINIKKRCLNDIFLLLPLVIIFSTAILIEIQASLEFIVFVVLGYVLVLLFSLLSIWKKIESDYFNEKTKDKKISILFLSIVSCCSALGMLAGRILSVMVEDDVMTIVLLFVALVLSSVFIYVIAYNLMALYCFFKINKN